MQTVDFSWASQSFTLFPEGCLFWKQEDCLIFSDVHLGKDHHFRKNGIPVPSISEVDTKQIVKRVRTVKPSYVVFLGDLVHVPDNNDFTGMILGLFQQLNVGIYWILGNHDPLMDIEFSRDIIVLKQCQKRGIHLVHDTEDAHLFPVIQGHIHPTVTLSLPPKGSYRYPALVMNKQKMVLPAYGTFTGGQRVNPRLFNKIFLCTGKECVELK